MKTQKLLLIATISLSVIISCKKNDVIIDPLPVITTVGDSNYLSKIYYIDSSNNNVQDTFGRLSVSYDNAKRVQIIIDSAFYNGGMPFSLKTVFYYTGADSLPFKSIREQYQGIYRDTTTSYYTYNTVGKKIKDSAIACYATISPTSSYTKTMLRTTIQYTGNKIYFTNRDSTIYDSYGGNYNSFSYDSATVDVSNNITSSKKTYPNGVAVNTITYDSYLNPYYHLNIFNCILTGPEFDDYGSYSKNNIVKVQEDRTTPLITTQHIRTFTFQYNKAGYPNQVVYLEQTNPATNYFNYVKTVYKYKAL